MQERRNGLAQQVCCFCVLASVGDTGVAHAWCNAMRMHNKRFGGVVCVAGTLVVTMPKENPNLRLARRLKQRQEEERKAKEAEEEAKRAARRARAPKKVGDMVRRCCVI